MFFKTDTIEGEKVMEKSNLKSKTLYPVKTAESLLSHVSHQSYIKRIKELSSEFIEKEDGSFDDHYFDALYHDLIKSFAEMVQCLPDQTGREFYLNNALLRALWALESYTEKSKASPNRDGDIYPYAIYSAALLSQVGELFSDNQIQFVNENGLFMANWDPIEGYMTNFNCEWFRVYKIDKLPQEMIDQLTSIIAVKIIPDLGYQWLSQDRTILQWWYDALIDRKEKLGQFDIDLNLEKKFVERARLHELEIENVYPTEIMDIESFLEWMKKKLEEKNKLNQIDGFAYGTRRGYLVTEKSMREYVEEHGGSVDSLTESLSQTGVVYGQQDLETYNIKHQNTAQHSFIGSGSRVENVKGIVIDKKFLVMNKDALNHALIVKSVVSQVARFMRMQENIRANKLNGPSNFLKGK